MPSQESIAWAEEEAQRVKDGVLKGISFVVVHIPAGEKKPEDSKVTAKFHLLTYDNVETSDVTILAGERLHAFQRCLLSDIVMTSGSTYRGHIFARVEAGK